MLLAREFGVQLGETLSPPTVSRRRTAAVPRFVSLGFDQRAFAGSASTDRGGTETAAAPAAAAAAAGSDLRVRRAEAAEEFSAFSLENEYDLAMMVRDFWENGSNSGDSLCSSDGDPVNLELAHLAENISCIIQSANELETEMKSIVHTLLLSVRETKLHVVGKDQCNGCCIRHSLVKLLKLSSYDAAICTSKWQGSEKVPGGDHEYIDIVIKNGLHASERLVVDIDFRSHFEIARAIEGYDKLLDSLPVVYVGTLVRLKQFLQVMVDASEYSLKKNSMPLPPWRSLEYLKAKWYSKSERLDLRADADNFLSAQKSEPTQCIAHLQRLKSAVQIEIKDEILLKPVVADKKWRTKPERHGLPFSAVDGFWTDTPRYIS